jgi:hypothetical protein
MYTYSIYTLVDITENGLLKEQFPFTAKSGDLIHDVATLTTARNQQANFTTMIQLLQIRGNIIWESSPVRIKENIANYKFGHKYEGSHNIWTFSWQVEQTEIYGLGADPVFHLTQDFDQIPVVNFCKETATFPASAFITQDYDTINTYFSQTEDLHK